MTVWQRPHSTKSWIEDSPQLTVILLAMQSSCAICMPRIGPDPLSGRLAQLGAGSSNANFVAWPVLAHGQVVDDRFAFALNRNHRDRIIGRLWRKTC